MRARVCFLKVETDGKFLRKTLRGPNRVGRIGKGCVPLWKSCVQVDDQINSNVLQIILIFEQTEPIFFFKRQ